MSQNSKRITSCCGVGIYVAAKDNTDSNWAQAPLNVLPIQYKLTTAASPAGTGLVTGAGTYTEGIQTSVTATPATGYKLKSLNGGTNSTVNVIMDKNQHVVASFEKKTYTITISLRGEVGPLGQAGTSATAAMTMYINGQNVDHRAARAEVGEVNMQTYTYYVPYGTSMSYDLGYSVYSDHFSWSTTSNFGTASGSSSWTGLYTVSDFVNQGNHTVTDNIYISWGVGTPLLIDISGNGNPDLLAGTGWKNNKERRPVTNIKAYRDIDLDGTGSKLWEWVDSKDGLLVYLPGLTGTPNFEHLFGTKTFNKPWSNGFEPLETLDKNKDGTIEGKELEPLGIWVDVNSDAIAQDGEIKPIHAYNVESISVAFQIDENGNTHNSTGVLMGGREVAIWDWISLGYPKLDAHSEKARFEWTSDPPPADAVNIQAEGMEPLKMLQGGTIVIYAIDEKLYARAIAKELNMDVVYPASLAADGTLQWGMDGLSNILLPSGDEFFGITVANNKVGKWSARLVSGEYPDPQSIKHSK